MIENDDLVPIHNYSLLAAAILGQAEKDSKKRFVLFDNDMFFVCKALSLRFCSGNFNDEFTKLKRKCISTKETICLFRGEKYGRKI